MSVDLSVRLLNWLEFLDAHESAESTEELFDPDAADEAGYIATDSQADELASPVSGSYDAAMEASGDYDFRRELLSPGQRDACDEVFAPLFWVFEIRDSDEFPWGEDYAEHPTPVSEQVRFAPHDVPTKGERINLQALLSPSSVKRLADLWERTCQEAIGSIPEEHYEDYGWGDWFQSKEELDTYFAAWGNLLRHAASRDLGMAILVG